MFSKFVYQRKICPKWRSTSLFQCLLANGKNENFFINGSCSIALSGLYFTRCTKKHKNQVFRPSKKSSPQKKSVTWTWNGSWDVLHFFFSIRCIKENRTIKNYIFLKLSEKKILLKSWRRIHHVKNQLQNQKMKRNWAVSNFLSLYDLRHEKPI